MAFESQQGIIGFIIKYKFTFVFALIFIALFRQSIWINNFPTSVSDRQDLIDEIISENISISAENRALSRQIDAYIDDNLILIESRARYKYGLVKDGETYYQINAIVETDNTDETPESNL
ncbi:MAG: septum formation initiator family protein [Gammaproteobacteria bacterium]|nr:septum formation initiator family protein [Gammaproteobacteria bacterium]